MQHERHCSSSGTETAKSGCQPLCFHQSCDQHESIIIQQEHWKNFAAQHLEWGFVGAYGNILTRQEERGPR